MINQEQLMLWTLILTRCTGVILLNPILGRRNLPGIVRAGFIMALTLLVFNFQPQQIIEASGFAEYALLLIKELAVGFILGYIVQLFTYIPIYAGGIIDYQMGLSMATIYDVQSNASIPITGTVFNTLFILIFFAADGHLALLRIFMESGLAVPYGQIAFSPDMAIYVLSIFTVCTTLAIQLAFPIMAIEFFAEVGVGILMKAIPQINVFIVNIQAKILIGMIVLVFMFSPMGDFINNTLVMMTDALRNVINLM